MCKNFKIKYFMFAADQKEHNQSIRVFVNIYNQHKYLFNISTNVSTCFQSLNKPYIKQVAIAKDDCELSKNNSK